MQQWMTQLCCLLQVKEEGWWLVVGDATTQELHAIKRMSFGDRATARLTFRAPFSSGSDPFSGLQLYLVCHSALWRP
jgi:hypothetical protein